MPALVAGIHALLHFNKQDVDGPRIKSGGDKPGHDGGA
jgi:hypothetical protein